MPEGDTILSIARTLRPVLVDRPLERIETPQRRHALDRWPEKLADARITAIDTHGKHLFLRFDNGLTIRSHLRMSGRWRIFERGWDWGRRAWTAWLVLETATHTVVQFNGPVLELVRSTRTRFDPYLNRLGPDILAEQLDLDAILVRLRSDDQTRPVADALLDQRTVAGIGNLWKNESLYDCRIDPWRPLARVDDDELRQVVFRAREMMKREVRHGGRLAGGEVFEQGGKGCRRCGRRIRVRGQWDENRMTYWCPGCQK
ncbi:MAG: DNA-formamidopyrimidine glycosylase family protein [Solirubrobacterales bacterium]